MAMSLPEMIIKLREASGLSQRALARRLDVDPSYLSRLERGKREPSIEFLRQLARETSTPMGLMLAASLLPELPEREREAYEPILEKLREMANTQQTELELSDSP